MSHNWLNFPRLPLKFPSYVVLLSLPALHCAFGLAIGLRRLTENDAKAFAAMLKICDIHPVALHLYMHSITRPQHVTPYASAQDSPSPDLPCPTLRADMNDRHTYTRPQLSLFQETPARHMEKMAGPTGTCEPVKANRQWQKQTLPRIAPCVCVSAVRHLLP